MASITVSPALTELDLSINPPTTQLYYTNQTENVIQLTFHAQDFTSLEEGWKIKFLETPDPQSYRYSLSSWMEFSPPTLLVKPNQTATLQVRIRNEALSAGGHYGSIIADVTQAPPPSSSQVNIKSQLVSLVFVRTATGNERDSAQISQFESLNPHLVNLPQTFVLRLDNTGNTHLYPHGLVVLKDFLGREVSRGLLNLDSLPTLPETIRRYDIPMTIKQVTWPLPGPYQASLTVNYNHQSITTHLQFISLGSWINAVLLALILILPLFAIWLKRHRK